MTPDERPCVECLRWHEDRLSKLLQILGGAKFVARRDDDMFRGFYREIKRDLKDECAAGTAKGVAQSQPERVWLQQPLSEAHTARVASATVRFPGASCSTASSRRMARFTMGSCS